MHLIIVKIIINLFSAFCLKKGAGESKKWRYQVINFIVSEKSQYQKGDYLKPELSSNNSSIGKPFSLTQQQLGPISQAVLWLKGKKLKKKVKLITKIAAVLLFVSSSAI